MYDISNYHYAREHGTEPRGRGCWAFESEDGSTVWFVDIGLLTLTEAKREICRKLKSEGVDPTTPIYVAP